MQWGLRSSTVGPSPGPEVPWVHVGPMGLSGRTWIRPAAGFRLFSKCF